MSLLCLCPLCLGSRCFSSNSLSSCGGKKGYWPTSQSTFAQKGTAKQKTFIFIHSASLLGTEWPDMVSYIVLVKDTMGYELSRTRWRSPECAADATHCLRRIRRSNNLCNSTLTFWQSSSSLDAIISFGANGRRKNIFLHLGGCHTRVQMMLWLLGAVNHIHFQATLNYK